MELLADYHFWGLFLSAFLAATVLPLSSEVVLVLLLSEGYDPVSAVSIATAGNVLGSAVNYIIGIFGSLMILERLLGISKHQLEKAKVRFNKYGLASLLFAWVPVIGDPLTVAAGILKINFGLFLLLVSIGKCGRYVAIAWGVP